MNERKLEVIKESYDIKNQFMERRKLSIKLELEHNNMIKDEYLTMYERFFNGFMSILGENIRNKYPNISVEEFFYILENILSNENIISNFIDNTMDNIKDIKNQDIIIENTPIYLIHNKKDIGDYYLLTSIDCEIDDLSNYNIFIGDLKKR